MPLFKLNRIDFFYEPTVIFARNKQWIHAREPVLRRMPDGSLVCLHYSGGKREPAPENLALITRSHDDGATWSTPEVLFKHDSRCVWPTEIFTEGERPIAFIHTFDYHAFYSELRAFMTFSGDSGKTWSEPKTVPGVPPNFSVRQGKVLSDGSWLFPVYWMEQDADWNWKREAGWNWKPSWKFRTGVIRSTNGGRSFSLHGYLRNDGLVWEPEVVELEAGHLRMYVRSEGRGVLWQTESFDSGLTWTDLTPSDIPNSGTKFVLFKIGDAVILVNNSDPAGRRHLDLWVSHDGCGTWAKKLPLAQMPDDVPFPKNETDQFAEMPWICYPHGFADEGRRVLYLACDSVDMHYLMKIPFADFL